MTGGNARKTPDTAPGKVCTQHSEISCLPLSSLGSKRFQRQSGGWEAGRKPVTQPTVEEVPLPSAQSMDSKSQRGHRTELRQSARRGEVSQCPAGYPDQPSWWVTSWPEAASRAEGAVGTLNIALSRSSRSGRFLRGSSLVVCSSSFQSRVCKGTREGDADSAQAPRPALDSPFLHLPVDSLRSSRENKTQAEVHRTQPGTHPGRGREGPREGGARLQAPVQECAPHSPAWRCRHPLHAHSPWRAQPGGPSNCTPGMGWQSSRRGGAGPCGTKRGEDGEAGQAQSPGPVTFSEAPPRSHASWPRDPAPPPV